MKRYIFGSFIVAATLLASLACGGGGGSSSGDSAAETESPIVHQVNIEQSATKTTISGNLLGSQTISEPEKAVEVNDDLVVGTGANVVIEAKTVSVGNSLNIGGTFGIK